MRALLLVIVTACGSDKSTSPAPSSRLAPTAPAPAPTMVRATGTVFDRDVRQPVANVTIVLLGNGREYTTTTDPRGAFSLDAPRGRYRAFVRDDRVMSTGMQGRLRLRIAPTAVLAGAPDDKLMPVLDLDRNVHDLELTVTVGAVIQGSVTDERGEPIAGATVAAQPRVQPILRDPTTPAAAPVLVRRNATRPVLGTDIAVTDERGHYALRVAAGGYDIVASHPRFAGPAAPHSVDVVAGDHSEENVSLVRGCIITGRVTTADGSPVHDGALETEQASTFDLTFNPTGRIAPDGTFRWTTTEPGAVRLRAWPWHSPPSNERIFDCFDGQSIADVVLTVPTRAPDLAGQVTDADGQRVPLAFLDVASLDNLTVGQQERASAAGDFAVYSMPAGRYQISTSAAGRGFVQEIVTGPRRDLALKLSGSGRIVGTTTNLVDGTFELTMHYCGTGSIPVELDDDPRVVVVRGGQFVIDEAPACTLVLSARWRDKLVTTAVVVEPDGTAYLDLPIGDGALKQVRGVVRDASGDPVRDARVTAVIDGTETTTVRSGDDGHFTVRAAPGASLVASNGIRVGKATVGTANVTEEQVDVVLDGDAQ